MGLIAEGHVDLPDQEMMNELGMVLSVMDSESQLTGQYVGGHNGPYKKINMPIRQAVQLAYDALFAKGLRSDFR